MGRGKKKRDDDQAPVDEPPTKKPRKDGEVAILSANVCGLDRATWDIIKIVKGIIGASVDSFEPTTFRL
jgi:hypothetical protein